MKKFTAPSSGRRTFAVSSVLLFAFCYLHFAFFTLSGVEAHAQSQQSFNYQLIARDTSGLVFSNRILGLQISILEDTESGLVVYSERHLTITNKYGLVNIEIGNGSVVSGSFNTIDWGSHLHFIKLEIDPAGGTNYFTMGTTQLVSVPYALYAEKAGNVVDTSNTNELQALSISNDTLFLSNGGFVKLPAGTSADWTRNGNNLYNNNSGNVGIGTNAPAGKLIVKGDSLAPATEPLFEVKNKDGDPVLIVYPDSVRITITQSASKANAQGGFAVSGRSSLKGATGDYLLITPDSARIYLDSSPDKASAQGGFAVSGRSSLKGTTSDYLSVNSDSVKVSKSLLIPRMTTYERDNLGFTPSEALIIFNMTDECMQIFKNSKWSNIWCFNCAPSIIIQPVDDTICSGNNVSFLVSLTGTDLVYQWQQSTDGGNTWSNLSNGSSNPSYSGATSWTLTLTNVPVSHHGYKYRCNVTASCPPAVTSNVATLYVGSTPPLITVHPSDQALSEDCFASFSIGSSGYGVSYQWQQSPDGISWSNISNGGSAPNFSGTTTATVSLSNVPLAYNNYKYRCIASNSCGADASSNAATLTVTPIVISTQPADQQLSTSCTATFSVTSSGPSLIYQWQVSPDGTTWTDITNGGTSPVYSNTTTASLSLSNVPLSFNNYKFRCNLSHFCRPSITSNTATLTIPAISITTQPADQTLSTGCAATFSITVSGSGFSYQWQQSADSGTTWNNITNGGTSPVYSGATTASLALSNAPLGYNNYKYRCALNHACRTSINSNAVTLTVSPTPTINTQPSDQQLSTSCAAIFTISVSGTGIIYQWQQSADGGNTWTDITDGGTAPTYSGAYAASLSLSSVPMGYNAYKYKCIVSHFCRPSSTSNAATLSVVAPAITVQPGDKPVLPGQNASFSITAPGTGLSYQWQESADGGNSWGNTTDGGTTPVYSGVTTSSLSLTNVPVEYNNYKYHCIVSTSCSPDSISSVATLSVVACSGVTDVDAYTYDAVAIGNQCWMRENLKTTKYRDNTAIPYITDNATWAALTTGAYSDYNNTPSNSDTYGRLYNWYAATDAHNICPVGWHVPSDAEWTQLISYLGGASVAGGKMKEAGTAHWNSPNEGADNSSGFTALPCGLRAKDGTYYHVGNYGNWWSSTEYDANDGWSLYVNRMDAFATLFNAYGNGNKSEGYSVRCLRD